MANEKPREHKSAPPPPDLTGTAPPSAAAAAVEPREKIEAKHMGADAFRPFRYTGSFVWGTVKGGLNGMARGGQLGLRLGMFAGLALWMAPAFGFAAVATGGLPALLGLVVMSGFYGFLGGAAVSGSLGLLTGGAREVGRNYRKEKYADELATRQESRGVRRGHGLDYGDRYDLHRKAASYNVDRLMQQEQRTNHDINTYWQDRVSGGDHGTGRGM